MMAVRTSDEEVRAIIETDPGVSIDPFIRPATALTDYVESKDDNGILTENLLTQIETYLAAHFYARRDSQYRTKKTGDATGEFQGRSGMRLDGTDWGQDAMALDVTGTLMGINLGKRRVSSFWLGKAPSDQTDYVDRN